MSFISSSPPPQSLSSQKNTSTREVFYLILAVFIAGVCSIIYELLIGAVSSYFLGDSIKQFSLTIGVYMASMGVGSYLSRYIKDDSLIKQFVIFEMVLGLLGGCSVPILYFSYAYTDFYITSMIILTSCIGICIGLEIPFLTRIMERYYKLDQNLSNVLSVDYLGALVATLLFPFVLLPMLGTFKSAVFFGLVNMFIGVFILLGFRKLLTPREGRLLIALNILCFLTLLIVLISSSTLMSKWNNKLYQDRVIYSKESRYQNIILTKNRDDLRLFLNGSLQFSSKDEYRYHESLVHIPILYKNLTGQAAKVLFIGGGDGLGVREALKHESVEQITLVDLDPEVTRLAKEHPMLVSLNDSSLFDHRVKVIHQDAHSFLEYLDGKTGLFDVIILDLPDPNNASLARLYSRDFYQLTQTRLDLGGIVVTQATSPFFARKAFWSINKTMQSAGYETKPYHISVPSFGEWGFIMASRQKLPSDLGWHLAKFLDSPLLQFLDHKLMNGIFNFAKDLQKLPVDESTIDSPVVLDYYLEGWRAWN